jgi:N-acyl amino acid synthase of PEP-CTERM/exosortase system
MGYSPTPASLFQIDRDVAKFGTEANSPRLIDLYHSYFEIVPAETEEQRRQAFHLRYQVYCVENAFEDPAQNPTGFESDAFDSSALHSLLIHRSTGDVVGTVRLILPQLALKGAGLPMRDICSHDLITRDNQIIPWVGTAEISRFAVSKSLRRRAGDGSVVGGAGRADHDPRR